MKLKSIFSVLFLLGFFSANTQNSETLAIKTEASSETYKNETFVSSITLAKREVHVAEVTLNGNKSEYRFVFSAVQTQGKETLDEETNIGITDFHNTTKDQVCNNTITKFKK